MGPDDITGAAATLIHRFAADPPDTRADLVFLREAGVDAMFYPPVTDIAVEVTPRLGVGLATRQDLRWQSTYRPLAPGYQRRYLEQYKPLHQAVARRIQPKRAGTRPRLMYIHGYMQPETPVEELGFLVPLALALNMEVVHIQMPFHGRRNRGLSPLSGSLFWTADMVRSLEALRQSLYDARCLLSWMLRDDPRPVGIAGISMGGVLALALTCLDDRFAFSLPCIAHMDITAMTQHAPVLTEMRRHLREQGWGPGDFDKLVQQTGWNDLRPQLEPDRVCVFAGERDQFFPPQLVSDMLDTWGRPKVHWSRTSHLGWIPRLPSHVRRMRTFLDGLYGSR